MNSKAALSALSTVALGLAVAGCGSGSQAQGVQLAPSAGATSSSLTATPSNGTATSPSNASTATTATTAASSAAVTTPTSGPLATEPKITIPSGAAPTTLVTKDLITGSGPAARDGNQLWVNYVGELYKTGKVFDASWKDTPGKAFGPFQLGAGAVIKGWDQGLVGMKVGGRRELIIPPALAYQAAGQGPIPPNATLVFVIDLLKIK